MAVVVMVGVVGEGSASAHRRDHAVAQLSDRQLADPSPLRTGGQTHLFGTGPGFPTLSSKRVARGFRVSGRAMPRSGLPRWHGTGTGGTRHLWAPHVARVRGPRGPGYVMYFTATRRGGWDCVGVARSSRPARGFRAAGPPLVCAGRRATIIDPSLYVGPHGRRWLTYVRRDRVTGIGQVRIIGLGKYGMRLRPGARSRVLVQNGRTITEAPSMLTHRGRTWLFVSRYSYRGCGYRTEVYRARTPDGRFRPAGPDHGRLVLRSRAGRVLCGAGGGEVLKTRRTVRFYFHAWRGGTEYTGGRRVPFVAKLVWRNGRPVVARR
ncbi:family 43 glycosylhydrolase [Nocardioides sp.]|uniref:family 43 glycosylhydrolase n=1 Tax=Nocardioides sp. TaxID=35761 RepID=UPI002CAE65AA|nr:family 43 glycosylhydrolase [Nocardioides sp.]HSX67887.1 family 43 glycosylhydrolase [Nocardioides sp.]